jgi:hypothetical protein
MPRSLDYVHDRVESDPAVETDIASFADGARKEYVARHCLDGYDQTFALDHKSSVSRPSAKQRVLALACLNDPLNRFRSINPSVTASSDLNEGNLSVNSSVRVADAISESLGMVGCGGRRVKKTRSSYGVVWIHRRSVRDGARRVHGR